jgi:hypothetical protein
MALRPCRECREQISSSAKTCPKCGAKDPVRSIFLPMIGVAMVVLLMVAIIAAPEQKSTERARAEVAPPAAPATTLPTPAQRAEATAGREVVSWTRDCMRDAAAQSWSRGIRMHDQLVDDGFQACHGPIERAWATAGQSQEAAVTFLITLAHHEIFEAFPSAIR